MIQSVSEPSPTPCTLQKIAFPALVELVASVALSALCSLYTAPAYIPLIVATVAGQWVINGVIRAVGAHLDTRGTTDWITSYFFFKGSVQNVQRLIHEQGHAIAANALYKQANARISFMPYQWGATKYTVGDATDLGKMIGETNIRPLVAAAGPLLTLTASMGAFATGLSLMENNPELAKALVVASVIDFLTQAVYALSALFTSPSNFNHDFVVLWQLGGIHPVAAMVAIVAVPILILAVKETLCDGDTAGYDAASGNCT